MNLKQILMELGNNLVTRRGFAPAAAGYSDRSTFTIHHFTTWVNSTPEARQELAELGVCWPMKSGDMPPVLEAPLEDDQTRNLIDDRGRITVIVKMPFQELICSGLDGTIEGFNDIVDDYVGTVLSDVKYRPVHIEGNKVWIEVNGEVDESFLDT